MVERFFRGPLQGPSLPEDFLVEEDKVEETLATMEKYRVEDLEISNLLDDTDFSEIERILSQHLVKSTGDEHAVAHIVPKDHIACLNTEGLRVLEMPLGASMVYISTVDHIAINVDAVKEKSRNLVGPRRLYLLHLLFHEEGHAAASHYHQSARSGHSIAQIGLEQQRRQKGVKKPNLLFYILSEGVNDKLARQNTMEYLRANPMKGISNDDTRIFQDIYAAHGSALHFTAIHIVDALVQKLAQKEGLEKEIIWNSLIHAQMNGLDLSNLKFQEQLDSGIGSKFTGELAHLTIEKIPPLLQKYNLEYRFKDFVQTLYDMKNRQDSLERNETTK